MHRARQRGKCALAGLALPVMRLGGSVALHDLPTIHDDLAKPRIGPGAVANYWQTVQ
jgi:hypothetical protein